jgi:outer membrane receptor protein involved in Fe transport
VPNWMANAGVEIYLPYNLMLRPEMRHVGDAFLSQDFNNVGEKLEAFTLFSLYLSYKPTFGKVSLTAFFGVENLTDEKYESFGMYGAPWSANTYYPMPGITFKGGLSLAF